MAPLSKLDAWTIVERTTKETAKEAVGLDLRELALNDVDEIGVCSSLQVVLLSANLFQQLSPNAFFQCTRLKKLDLARNGITALPDRNIWGQLRELVVLYLHDNQLASLHALGELVGLPLILRLTAYDNPLAKHPSYRHYCVNSLISLRALDLHVVSDEELIEGATFPPSLRTKCPAASLPIFAPPPPQHLPAPATDQALLAELRTELRELNRTHARLSPVLKLQSAARSIVPRRRLAILKKESGQAAAAKEYAKQKLAQDKARREAEERERAEAAERERLEKLAASGRPTSHIEATKELLAAPSPKAPTSQAFAVALVADAPPADPSPKAPTPKDPSPLAPPPKDPSPKAPTPKDPSPKAPTPKDPSPKAPTPKDPSPKQPLPPSDPPSPEEEKATVSVQAAVRGHVSRQANLARHMANLHAPYLYVQTRHVHELEALLPEALGRELAEQVYFEPTDCYTIRHSGELPADLTNPPLSGLLIRQRAQQPPKYKLRLTYMPREAKELKALSRSYVRPTNAELRLLQKAFEAADREDRGVQMSYERRQLVRLVLPDAIHLGAVLSAASARNADLLRTMGVDPSQAALSPKVLSELLVPLTPPAIDVVLATVTLQRVWRSIACRAKVQPSLIQRLIRLRASTRVQRWWRWWLVKERFRMLRLVRERVIATTSNKLYLPTAVYEDLKGKYPLHAKGLWPEHSSLKFTFAHTHEQNLQYFVLPDAMRPEMPHWAAPRIPIAQTRSLQQPQESLALLTVGVRMASVPKAQLKRFVSREWTCLGFLSTLEASRRVAVLTAISYEPLALRTIHGRLQGTYFAPLFLYTWGELERWEAASCIQAAALAMRSRKLFSVMLKHARAKIEEERRVRAAARAKNSLFSQGGSIDVEATVPPPPKELAARPQTSPAPGPNLNLSREQLERMIDGQAEVLGVYGLPPTVSAQGEIGKVLSEQLAREAKGVREMSAATSLLLAERRAAEVAAAREMMREVRDAREARFGSADESAFSPLSPGAGDPAEIVGGGHPSARALMAMMQSVVMSREESYEDVAALQARQEAERRSVTAMMRAELKQAHAELLADKELERQELLVQSRLERRQLQHALDERHRALNAEVHLKQTEARALKEAIAGRKASRSFTGSFVRQQNAMIRQLQLGDLRRRKEEVLQATLQHTEQQRRQADDFKQSAASEARRRAQALREGNRKEKLELEKKREAVEVTRQRELDLVHLKQLQLREIRTMLSQPVDLSTGLPASMTTATAAEPMTVGRPSSPKNLNEPGSTTPTSAT